MFPPAIYSWKNFCAVASRPGVAAFIGPLALALALGFAAHAQQPAQSPTQPTAQPAAATPVSKDDQVGGITEDQLKQMLVGKQLFLRGGYLEDSLSFNEHGVLIGNSPRGSYTLCGVQIERVRLDKHKVELEGVRYGLHFLGELPYEVADPSKAADRVRITPSKKMLKITIDRQEMVKPKKENEKEPKKDASFGWIWHRHEESGPTGQSGAGQSQAVTAATPASAEKPAAAESAAETTSPAHATMVLTQALDNVFASGLDARVVAAMPAFWKLYYQAVAAKSDYRPTDPAVLRQDQVDRKAKLLSITQPDSNQYAQDAGVAGMALYHVVVGPDGNAHEIAVARPIGFGLDENAVAAIRKAAFQPALEAGKPVPVLLDLVVEFRIYSKRTDVVAPPGSQQKSAAPVLPGPYSVQDK